MKKTEGASVIKFPEGRSWQAGDMSTLLENWTTASQPVDSDIRRGLRAIRARSRDAAQNNDHARHFLKLVSTNVVGRGVGFQSKARLRNGKPDQRLAETIEEAFSEFSDVGQCDVTGLHSRSTLERLLIETVARDGEAIIRYMPYWDNETNFAVQVIDPEVMDIDYNEALRNGNNVRMGVELDQWRRPVAYWLKPESPPNSASYYQGKRVRVPVEEIDHIYMPEWTWQSRGVPWMAASLHRMNMLGGYEDAAVTAARLSAAKMMFYRQNSEFASDLNPGTEEDGQFVQDVEPGLMEKLPLGWDISTFDSNWPNVEHGAFVKSVIRGFSAGLLVSYNALSSDLEGVNYSSLREGSLRERDIWMVVQDWFLGAFHKRLYPRWLKVQLERGIIPETKYAEARRVSWQPRRWSWVDPLKDVQAAEKAVAMRLRSVSDLIREQGRDPDEVWTEIAADKARMEELGITPEEAIQAVSKQVMEDDENN